MCNDAAKQASAGVAPCKIKDETCSGTLKLRHFDLDAGKE